MSAATRETTHEAKREAAPEAASARYKATELAPNVWTIEEGMVRCFLIIGDERALLIDSCAGGGDEFAPTVRSLTNKPIELAFTHTDRDHTAGQEGFGKPWLHPSEFDYYARSNAGREVRALWEGDIIDLGDTKLEALLLPGHTPGNLMFLDRENRRLFSGDSIQDFGVFLFGEGRNLFAFIESMKKLEPMTSEFDRVFSCHGSATLPSDWVTKTCVAAELLLAGKLEGEEPPMNLPCKAYRHDGVTLLY